MARLQCKPEIEAQILLDVAKDYKPEDLSPILLGQVGDCLVQNGQQDQAVPFYNQLMDEYDKSTLVDYAYNGLAQIALAQKDYKKADHYFSVALDKGLAASKLKEITLGEAQALAISPQGDITLNDEPFDSITSTELPQLKATLMRLKQAGDAAQSSVLITIVSDPQAKYRRTINVLDALAVAGIGNVTFTVSEDEQ
jgi:biopolymer transport protein ExbD